MKAIITIMLAMHLNYGNKIERNPFIELDRATTYYCEESQCNGDPFTTADGSVIDVNKLKTNQLRWCALSRNLIWDEYRQTIHKQGFRGLFE